MLGKLTIICLVIGLSNCSPFGSHVVNGTDADEGEFPFVASLQKFGSHSCGSSILSDEWILTAAHCVKSWIPGLIKIQYSITTISGSNGKFVKIQKIIVHEDYNPSNSYINDIALLKLATKIEFSNTVQPVKLPKLNQEYEGGTPARLIGWGQDMTGGSIQKHLQKVDLITFSDEDCNRRHEGKTHLSQICAGILEGGKGQCGGDSGGPLLIDGEQVGIVSWSVKPCTIAPYPGVYTKVSHFRNWIENKTGLKF